MNKYSLSITVEGDVADVLNLLASITDDDDFKLIAAHTYPVDQAPEPAADGRDDSSLKVSISGLSTGFDISKVTDRLKSLFEEEAKHINETAEDVRWDRVARAVRKASELADQYTNESIIESDDERYIEGSEYVRNGTMMALRSALPMNHSESWPQLWLKKYGSLDGFPWEDAVGGQPSHNDFRKSGFADCPICKTSLTAHG